MGYIYETRSNMEYGSIRIMIFSPRLRAQSLRHDWCNSIVWGTWFTASPGWIYGIQWLPSGPSLAFYDRDPKFIAAVYADLERELETFAEKEAAKKPRLGEKASRPEIPRGRACQLSTRFPDACRSRARR